MRALAIVVALAGTAHAGPLAIGISAGLPGHGTGPAVGTEQIPLSAVVRLALDRLTLDGGVGSPVAGVGLSLWAGVELRHVLAPWLAAYASPGLRVGFVGPSYYARHDDVFVGYAYIYSGPWTIAPRLRAGLAAPIGRAEAFLEALVEVPLLPSVELLPGAAVGVRVRL